MSAKQYWKKLLAGSAAVGVAACFSVEALAQTAQPQQLAQVTSISQLSDVQPTDWAFAALQSLVERYGCIAGYPDSTYRGNRAMTRYEFAAGLNACLDRINELIAAGLADKVSREDLATVQRLQEEFAAELEALRGRVDALEAKTAELEANPLGFDAATSKLGFEIVTGIFAADDVGDADNSATFPYRVRMNFDASFTGDDQFRVRLQAREAPNFNGVFENTGRDSLSFSGNTEGGGGDSVGLDDVYYLFPAFNDRVDFLIGINGVGATDIFNYATPFDALSDFADVPDPTNDTDSDQAFAFNWSITDSFALAAGYTVPDDGEVPGQDTGIFEGRSLYSAELSWTPSDSIIVALAYTYDENNPLSVNDEHSNAFGAGVTWELTPSVVFSGWYAYTDVSSEDEYNDWLVGLAFPDLFVEGSNAGILAGSPDTWVDDPGGDYPIQVEGYYSFPVTDNINITPGVYYLTNANGNGDDAVVGGVRTTFSF